MVDSGSQSAPPRAEGHWGSHGTHRGDRSSWVGQAGAHLDCGSGAAQRCCPRGVAARSGSGVRRDSEYLVECEQRTRVPGRGVVPEDRLPALRAAGRCGRRTEFRFGQRQRAGRVGRQFAGHWAHLDCRGPIVRFRWHEVRGGQYRAHLEHRRWCGRDVDGPGVEWQWYPVPRLIRLQWQRLVDA